MTGPTLSNATEVVTLTGFLLARIAEDEAVARAAAIPAHDAPGAYKPHPELTRWRYAPGGEVEYDYDDPHPYPDVYRVTQDGEGLQPAVTETIGPHIARHDPARVLAECVAKRRIVEMLSVPLFTDEGVPFGEGGFGEAYAEALAHLAAVYADHSDYREEWRP